MERKEFVLAALAPAKGHVLRPVQVQKLFFLIDREIPNEVDGPRFDFQPYDYGPFDSEVYSELRALAADGLVDILQDWNWSSYRLTVEGQEKAEKFFKTLSKKARDYIATVTEFVRGLSFTELVSAIYKAYPEMRANSAFRE